MNKQVTYEDYTEFSGQSELSLTEMLDLFDRMNWADGSFIGFPIDEIYFFQIMCNKDGSFTAEFLDDGDIYQKTADKSECRTMVKNFFEKQSAEPEIMNGFKAEKPELLYNSVKGSWWKKALFLFIFIGFFVGLLVLGAYIIYW